MSNTFGGEGARASASAGDAALPALSVSRESAAARREDLAHRIYFKDLERRFTWVNQPQAAFLGLSDPDEAIGHGEEDFLPPELVALGRADDALVLETGEPVVERIEKIEGKEENGREPRCYSTTKLPIRDSAGEIFGLVGISRDITESRRIEEQGRDFEEMFAGVSEVTQEALFLSEKGICLYQSPTAEKMFGYSPSEALGRAGTEWIVPEDRDEVMRHMLAGRTEPYGITALRKDGTIFSATIQARAIDYQGRRVRMTALRDVTERSAADEERRQLEAQLRQAQKMEAVGQLAGGIAHDFNNILTAILGNVELLQEDLESGQRDEDRLKTGLEQISSSGQRAASLIRHLLAFSRRQVIQPQVLDPNDVLRELFPMLPRLLGTRVELELSLDEGVSRIRADVAQLEQVVLNLAVNARDAITDGGTLTIRTGDVIFDESFCATHPGAKRGHYVMLALHDTGHGMDDQTREHIFEPFFTTKPMGQGTGLGLSSAYGIVKQSNGYIAVDSELGRGAAFSVYLPAVAEPAEDRKEGEAAKDSGEARGGTETVLLCEDEDGVREFARRVLEDAGYRVLVAENGKRGIEIAALHPSSIHLLVTDVFMPGLDGGRLARSLRSTRPDLEVLFISGYTANIVARHGVLEEGVMLLEKPFTRRRLLELVREVLDPAKT
jgi:two-component system, cell cycle sensor histidine kinase and response regulator CckA